MQYNTPKSISQDIYVDKMEVAGNNPPLHKHLIVIVDVISNTAVIS